LDNDLILQQFEKVEAKVEDLIALCKSHEATNKELNNKIKQLEEELQSRIETEKRYQQEKALIRNKIDSLLVKLADLGKETVE
jgi:protein-arginine kinase activator protein McsA